MKIALVAMSGVRACDQGLLRLGLTLPGFVERSRTIASLPSLGLLTLAGMTPTQHDVEYVEVADIRGFEDARLAGFDLVAISSFSAQVKEAYELARRCRARGTPVVVGGLHVTSCPDEPARCGASAVVGEGEVVWQDVLGDVSAGRLKPVYDARGREYDFRQTPMPAFHLLDIDRYNRLTIQTSRGCPWRCAFCASSILLTGRYKQKPVRRVLEEVDAVCDLWRRPFIEFADDNAFVNRGWWKQFLPELRRRRVKWFAETDVSVAEDDGLLAAMREAGCAEVLIGFESPSPAGLRGVELRWDWKLGKEPLYRDAVRRIQSHGIRVNACFVVGLDGHTADVFDDVYRFVEDVVPYDVQVTLPTPFPGTPFYHHLKKQGRLLEDGAWEKCTLFDVNFRPSHLTADELRQGFRELVVKLYGDAFTAYRRASFKSQRRGASARPHSTSLSVRKDPIMRHPIPHKSVLVKCAAAALPLAALAGCESSGLSAREAAGRNFSSYVYSLYDAPAQAGDAQQAALVLPSKLAVAQVGEVAPPTSFLEKLRARPELFSRVEGVSGAVYLSPEPRGDGGAGDSAITAESKARREMERIRRAARDMGMDHLLLVGGTIDQVTKENGLSILDLTVVGAFVVPSKQVDAEAKASGALIDLATGRVALVASADASRGRIASSATQVSGEIDVMREARDEVLGKLAVQVIEQCERARASQGGGA